MKKIFLCLLFLGLSCKAQAFGGFPPITSWATITLQNGEKRDVMTYAAYADYESEDTKIFFDLTEKTGKKKRIWLDTNRAEQRLTFDWKKLSDVYFTTHTRQAMPHRALLVTYPFTQHCVPARTETIDLRDIHEINFHYRVAKERRDELWRTFSITENFKGCPIASCYSGDYDWDVTFNPGKQAPEEIKNAIELYCRENDYIFTDEEGLVKKTPADFSSVLQIMQDLKKMRSSRDFQGEGPLRQKLEKEMENLYTKWQVVGIPSTSPYSEEETWLPARAN